MSIIGSNILAGASGQVGGGYTIENSLRFRSTASAYLNRTPATAGNQQRFTWSGWVKRGALTGSGTILGAYSGGTQSQTNAFDFRLSGDYLDANWGNGTWFTTTAAYRDPSAWYHIVLAVDTTQATASSRMILYVNGALVTAFSAAAYPTQNTNLIINTATNHTIGKNATASANYFDGYMAEVNFIDGQALTPSDFGEYNEDTGVWQPAKYAGSYGTNGFYLPFSDATNTTTLVADASGNGNDWTPNNISLTAGSTYDSMTDTPTPYADGGNYAVMNPLKLKSSSLVLSDGNLKISSIDAGSGYCAFGSIAMTSGKWYWEFTITAVIGGYPNIGIGDLIKSQTANEGVNGTKGVSYNNGGAVVVDNTTIGTYSSFTTGDVIGISYDADNNRVYFAKNGTWQNSAVPSSGTGFFSPSAPTLGYVASAATYGSGVVTSNFGQRPFAYTPPTGFLPLHTGNLPDSTIVSGDDYFKTYLYTGNGGGLQVGEIQKPFTTYEVSNSLRLRSSASAYLNRTPATAGNRKTWTWSGWVKLGVYTTSEAYIFSVASGSDNTNNFYLKHLSSGQLRVTAYSANWRATTALYRDPSAWYHVVLACDSTQATAQNRIRLYINGEEVTAWDINNAPSLDQNFAINMAAEHRIGQHPPGYNYPFDGYLAEVNFIDGQALTPSDLGDYDGNNYWVPKAYTGTYGTNGFYLDFSDTTSTATLVADQSGAGNDWTPNNISLTAGSTYDSMVDSPTPYANAGNYAVLNPLDNGGVTLSNANLTITGSGNAFKIVRNTFGMSSGKWYCEFVITTESAPSRIDFGLLGYPATLSGFLGDTANGYAVFESGGNIAKYNNSTSATLVSGDSLDPSDVQMLAYDADAGKLWFGKNGSWFASGDPAAGTSPVFSSVSGQTYFVAVQAYNSSDVGQVNFGQRPFAYTPPTGFKTLNSFNIPEDTTDLETPDLVWIKSRSASQSHTLFDSVRGVHNYLESDDTALEATDVNSLLQFNKNGFLLGASAAVNTSGRTYVGWGWKAGTAFSNDAGTNGATIASVGSVNQDAGFSIVTYTGTGAAATVGHGLGVAPSMVIVKKRSAAGDQWYTYHSSNKLPNANAADNRVFINLPAASNWDSQAWNNTNPTSSVFSIGSSTEVSASEATFVAYCFAEVPGYSKFGSYTANNSADGPFVYLGFKPKFVLHKRTDSSGDWYIWDSEREPNNYKRLAIWPNYSNPENDYAGTQVWDFVSNGMKARTNSAINNTGSATYIYMAFAENPFKNSLAG